MGNFAGGGIFLQSGGNLRKSDFVILTIQTFFKAKNSFLWILNINVSKEYEIKTKMVHEQWPQLKMKFLLGYNLKIVIYWGGGN